MTDKRLFLALAPLALLASCGGEADEEGAASGEVLEGTISDAMLPVDRVRSEAPLEDPEAFAEALGDAEGDGEGEGEEPDDAGGEAAAADADAADEAPASDPVPEADE